MTDETIIETAERVLSDLDIDQVGEAFENALSNALNRPFFDTPFEDYTVLEGLLLLLLLTVIIGAVLRFARWCFAWLR